MSSAAASPSLLRRLIEDSRSAMGMALDTSEPV